MGRSGWNLLRRQPFNPLLTTAVDPSVACSRPLGLAASPLQQTNETHTLDSYERGRRGSSRGEQRTAPFGEEQGFAADPPRVCLAPRGRALRGETPATHKPTCAASPDEGPCGSSDRMSAGSVFRPDGLCAFPTLVLVCLPFLQSRAVKKPRNSVRTAQKGCEGKTEDEGGRETERGREGEGEGKGRGRERSGKGGGEEGGQ